MMCDWGDNALCHIVLSWGEADMQLAGSAIQIFVSRVQHPARSDVDQGMMGNKHHVLFPARLAGRLALGYCQIQRQSDEDCCSHASGGVRLTAFFIDFSKGQCPKNEEARFIF